MSDQPTFDPGFSTPEMTAVFTPAATVAAILEFEAALAMAYGDIGLAPEAEAAAIATACAQTLDNAEEILDSTWEAGTPIIALIEKIRERIGTDGTWAHSGATTQDAIDTARMLQSKSALSIIEATSLSVAGSLRGLVVDYRDLPQMGRTFLQDSRPTMFGTRAAGWLSPVLTHIEELRACRDGLMLQLGGPSGSLADLEGAADDLVKAVARRLSLVAPVLAWHSDRSPIWKIARTVEATALTMAKIATDLALLAQSSVAEVEVRPGISSSMPGKKNPIDSVRAIAAAHACSGFASTLTGAPTNQLDRGLGGWHVEWLALPMLFHTASASCRSVERCLDSLVVDGEKMASRVDEDVVLDPRPVDGVLARFDEVVGGAVG